MSTPSWRIAVPAGVALLLPLVFLHRPVHVDEANFLRLAEGARLDAWRPHEVLINWQGVTERAFGVLSNPPGIAWWLAPLAEAALPLQRLAMLPWLLLALWGFHVLGRRFAGDGPRALAVLASAPIVLWASSSLTPDLPLLALLCAGLGGYVEAQDRGRPARAAFFAFLVGCAFLFRYSALALFPLLLLYPHRGRGALAPAIFVLLPPLLLFGHDLHAYGHLHFLAMSGFQSVAETPRDLFRKLVSLVCMLGGAGLLPIFVLGGGRAALAGAIVGGLLGLSGVALSGIAFLPALLTVSFGASGGALLLGPWGSASDSTDRDRVFLASWALLGLLFLLALRFSATRYWLPFLPAVALAWLRRRPSRPVVFAGVGLQAVLGLLLLLDDARFAEAQHALAARIADRADALDPEALAPRLFAGHWGWQHALERRAWRPVDEDAALPVGALFAVADAPWPQEPGEGCLQLLLEEEAPAAWPGPRVHTADGAANLHANVVAGHPPVETYAPWSLSREPLDRARLYRVCEGDPG
jgi:hypothetical protein